MDQIKQQKIKLDEDECNSRNKKNENDRLNMMLSVIGKIYQFFKSKFLLGKQSDQQQQPDQQQQHNQNWRLWATSMDHYKNLQKNVGEHQKKVLHIVLHLLIVINLSSIALRIFWVA